MHLNNELYHHGVLGMKWGVRRYQNKDGSLTAAGRRHVNSNSSDSNGEVQKKKGLSDSTKKKLKVGAAILGTAAVAAGAVYASKRLNTKAIELVKTKYLKSGKEYADKADYQNKLIEDLLNRSEAAATMAEKHSGLGISNFSKTKKEALNNLSKSYSNQAKNATENWSFNYKKANDMYRKSALDDYSKDEKVRALKDYYLKKRR